jgi:hypothetical protein
MLPWLSWLAGGERSSRRLRDALRVLAKKDMQRALWDRSQPGRAAKGTQTAYDPAGLPMDASRGGAPRSRYRKLHTEARAALLSDFVCLWRLLALLREALADRWSLITRSGNMRARAQASDGPTKAVARSRAADASRVLSQSVARSVLAACRRWMERLVYGLGAVALLDEKRAVEDELRALAAWLGPADAAADADASDDEEGGGGAPDGTQRHLGPPPALPLLGLPLMAGVAGHGAAGDRPLVLALLDRVSKCRSLLRPHPLVGALGGRAEASICLGGAEGECGCCPHNGSPSGPRRTENAVAIEAEDAAGDAPAHRPCAAALGVERAQQPVRLRRGRRARVRRLSARVCTGGGGTEQAVRRPAHRHRIHGYV